MRAFLHLAWLAVFMVGASYVATVALGLACAAWHGRSPSLQHLLVNPLPMDMLGLFLPLYLAVLLIDLVTRGWQASSLRQLSAGQSQSSRSDLGYLLLNASGLASVIGMVTFVGAGAWIESHVSALLGLNVAAGWPLWLAAPALVLWGGFWSYWEHRFHHTSLMWPLHKCHHSAKEFTVLTGEREHPIESAMANLMHAMVPASLGFPPDSIFLVAIVQAVASSIHHSNWHWLAGLEKVGLVTPSGHRVHHSVEPCFHDCNYGDLLNVWDRLFGTYVPPPRDVAALPIGVESLPRRHNTANPLTEVLLMMVDWLSPLGWLLKRPSWRMVTIGGKR